MNARHIRAPRSASRAAGRTVASLALAAILATLLAACSGGGTTPTGGAPASQPGASSSGAAAPSSASSPAGGASGGGASASGAASGPSSASGAAGSAASVPLRKIRVAHAFISAETLPIWVGLDQKLFERYGLSVEAVPLQTSAQVAPAMTSGDVQLALTTGSGEVEFNLAGGEHVIVAGYSNWMRYFLHARPDIRRVEDLRDKKIGITRRGGAIDVAAHIFLEKHGMTYGRDAAIIELGTAQNQLGGITAGAVDAVIVALPTNFQVEREGFPLIEDTRQHNVAFPTNVISVRRPYLQSNAEVVRDYLKGHIHAVEVIRKDKDLAKRLLGQNTGTDDQDLLERSYQVYTSDLQDVPYPSPEAIQGALDAIASDKPQARNAKPADFYDDRLVKELDESGFVRNVRGS
jgi:NitT/TauT family transport system substrate-binding protein